jgi:probable rRNA maturation factor
VSVRVTWSGGPRLAKTPEIQRAVRAALAHGGRPGMAIDVVIVDQEQMRRLHESALGDPTPTDVIAFDLRGGGGGPDGELYVSAEQARLVARRRGLDPRRELLLYAIHGALHLCGHDDREPLERRRMRSAERAVFALLDDSANRADESRTRARAPRRRRGSVGRRVRAQSGRHLSP